MKKIGISLVFLLISLTSFSQIEFGLKAGLNYVNFGDGSLKSATDNLITGADEKTGYHLGVFLKAKVPVLGVYLRPEFTYTALNTEYAWTSTNPLTADFDLSKIDVPILIGKKIIGPLHAFIGPAFQFVIDSDFDATDVTDIDTDSFSLGVHLGFGVQLGKFGIDVRWERGLSDTESKITRTLSTAENIVIDTRPNQIIFGLSYRFSEN